MSRSGERKEKRKSRLPSPDSSGRASSRERAPAGSSTSRGGRTPGGGSAAKRGARQSWLSANRRLLRFLLLLGLLVGGFNAFFYLWLCKGSLFAAYLGINAECTAAVLTILGDDVTVRGTSIASSRFSLDVKAGCDGIQASAFFVFAVLLAPVSVSRLARVGPVVLGTLLLLVLNVVRIVSLYYTGIYFPNAFETMHVDVWQGVFIFVPIIFWMIWSVWATRRRSTGADVST